MMRESRGGPLAHSQRVTSSERVSTTPSRVEVGLQRELIGQRGGERLEAGCGRVEAGPPHVEAEGLDRELRRVLGLGASRRRPPRAAPPPRRAPTQAPSTRSPIRHADDQLDQGHAAAARRVPSRALTGRPRSSSTTCPSRPGHLRPTDARRRRDRRRLRQVRIVVDAGDDDLVAVRVARPGAQRVEPVGGEDDGGAALARERGRARTAAAAVAGTG